MLRTSLLSLLLVVFGGLLAPPRPHPGEPQQAVIALDLTKSYQTIMGWEAVAQAGQLLEVDSASGKSNLNPAFDKYKDQLFDQAVSDLGINRLRLELRSGLENPVDYYTRYATGQIGFKEFKNHRYEVVNDNSDPQTVNPSGFQFAELDAGIEAIILPMRQKLIAKGEKLYVNLNYVDFQLTGFPLRDSPDEYAELIVAAFAHMRDRYGWTPDGLEMILEPDNAGWTPSQVGRSLVAVGNRLRANGFNPEISAPSTTSMGNAVTYFDQMILIPGVTTYLSELTYHRYADVSSANLQSIASRSAQYDVSTAQLEYIAANQADLHKDLTLGRNSSWAQYVLAYPLEGNDDGSAYYLVDSNVTNPGLSLGQRSKLLRQYFHFIRTGALRVGASTSNEDFDPVAFVNTDGTIVVVIDAQAAGTLALQGFPANTYGVRYSKNGQFNVDAGDVVVGAQGALTTAIPAAGTLTIYAKTSTIVSVGAASYSRSSSPGELAAAFGRGFPAGVNLTLAAPATPLPTKLGGVSLKVNGTPAPLFFVGVGGAQGAGAFQINYQMPYEASQGVVTLEVFNDEVKIANGYTIAGASSPGVFTANASGSGQAVALNQDLTFNGDPRQNPQAKPESRGRVVILFADGPGGNFVNPATGQPVSLASGAATPAGPLFVTSKLPLATIGGAPAAVAFSGLAPGFVGLWQLNLIIPSNSQVGNAIPVTIKSGRKTATIATIAVN